MADTGYKKQLWRSRAMRPGDASTTPAPKKVNFSKAPTSPLAGGGAPQKTDLNQFESKHGFGGGASFGRTGMTGET